VPHPVALGVEVALVEGSNADDQRAFSGLLLSRRTLWMPRSLRMPVAAP
jgi:hypothetical protein